MEKGWLVAWLILWYIKLCRLFNARSIFIQIDSFISNNSVLHKYSLIVKKISISSNYV